MSVWQLRRCAEAVGSSPTEILSDAERIAKALQAQGVTIVSEKRTNPAATLIGIGILLALLAK